MNQSKVRSWLFYQLKYTCALTTISTFLTISILFLKSKQPILWSYLDVLAYNGLDYLLLFSAFSSVLFVYAYKYVRVRTGFAYYLNLLSDFVSIIHIYPFIFAIRSLMYLFDTTIISYYISHDKSQ